MFECATRRAVREHREGCRGASATSGARTTRGGTRWRARGAARAAAPHDAGLTWRRAGTGGPRARRSPSPSTMAARRTYVHATAPRPSASRTSTRMRISTRTRTPTRTTCRNTCRTRTMRRTLTMRRTRSMPPRARSTAPLGNPRLNIVLLTHRFVDPNEIPSIRISLGYQMRLNCKRLAFCQQIAR